MYNVLAIAGKSGAGKDYILKQISSEYDVHTIISDTTRPSRSGEENGVNYHFISHNSFLSNIDKGTYVEHAEMGNGWLYGTSKTSLARNKLNIGVFNPRGVEQLYSNDDVDLTVMLVEADDIVRIKRSLNREEDPDVQEIVRRYIEDNKDFKNIDKYVDHTITNNGEDISHEIQRIMEDILA